MVDWRLPSLDAGGTETLHHHRTLPRPGGERLARDTDPCHSAQRLAMGTRPADGPLVGGLVRAYMSARWCAIDWLPIFAILLLYTVAPTCEQSEAESTEADLRRFE